ncbi:hypothetical protein KY329_04345, partial [Candidatus Woesearchaeota archaeon]|nr:hypothetical protein [Candidatus Woesearchaeota archaeon]
MQGPPGTGKSQTIANIVGECIARGKSVLFVSDKMAALEVVYKRLSDVGLAHFCLELHSSKANKQEVVAELKRSLDEQLIPGKIPSAHDFEKMKQLRERLNEYVIALHIKQSLLQKSAYEILGELITLQHIPFVQVELENPGSLTPQRMQELEELMVNLTNVWQVVEEQDFPWRGYRGTRYNLDIRSELIAQIEQIDATVNLLRLESSNYSQQLGLNPPSTLSRIKWLLGLNVFLSESPKPEAQWLLNPQIDSLLTEAKDHQETINWCTSTRNRLLESYNSQFFTLMLNTSEELELYLKDMQKYVSSSSVFDGELLKKREKLRSLVRNLSDMVAKWREKSVALGRIFGLSSDNLTFNRVKQFSRIAEFCFSPEKPEPDWFDNQIFQKARETFRRAKRDYEEFSSLSADLSQRYTERIYDLDLDEFTRKYSGPYNSFLKYFRPSYYRDQKQIALVSKQGRVPKTVRKDLLDARRVKALSTEIESYKNEVQQSLGHFYKGYETDFLAVEKAIQITEEVYRVAGTLEIPESLTKIISYPSNPPPEIKKLGTELAESVEKWESESDDLQNILPSKLPSSNLLLNQSSLENLEEWAIQTGRAFSPLYELTKEISETIKQEEPESYSVIIGDLQAAESVRKKEAEILNQKEALREKFGKRFMELETDWEDIIQVLDWTKKVQEYFESILIPERFAEIISEGSESAPSIDELDRLSQETPRVLSDLEVKFEDGEFYQGQQLTELDLEALHDRVKQLRDRIDDLQTFIDFKELKGQFSLIHLGGFFDRLVEQHPPRAELVDAFRRGAYQEWINNLYDQDPRLGKFRRENHEQLIEDFRALDQELIRLSSNMVIEAANSRKPQDILIQATDSEVNTLLKEAAKKRRLMPIRTLLQRIPHVLPKIKPCLLMSPISVSQFLDSEMMKFDLVLFDEASQIVPEDAIGAIYRGKSVVVAGDNRQLPPTSFFQKSLLDDFDWDEVTENEVEVFDSILDECLGIGLPVKTLRWHYRSRHEDLIAFSNSHFYEGNLVTFPSAEANHHALGVKLFYAEDGLYDRGGRRDNLKEAEIITDLVFEHFQNQPESTLG